MKFREICYSGVKANVKRPETQRVNYLLDYFHTEMIFYKKRKLMFN